MYEAGIDKKTIADYITKEVDKGILCTNNSELFEAPLNWGRLLKNRAFITDLDSGSYTDIANVSWTTGIGNCEENSTTVYYILKKAGVKEHVRIFRSSKHSFTVWGIHPSGDPNNPLTWGDNALVLDPWLGKNLTKEEVQKNEYFKNNDPDVKITDFTTFSDDDADSWNTITSRYNRENNIIPTYEDSEEVDCFIATAVYGTTLAPEIQVLRTYRDNVLRNKTTGRIFIKGYERFAPVFAYYIKNKENEKKWVRNNIVEPAVNYVNQKTKNRNK